MTLVSNGGTTTLGLYDTQSQLEKKADITYVDNKVDPLVGGHKGFATLALAQAAQGNLPSGSIVEVTNDTTTSNNGLYLWNGTTLTKSAYDPLTQAKLDSTSKVNASEENTLTALYGRYGRSKNVLDSTLVSSSSSSGIQVLFKHPGTAININGIFATVKLDVTGATYPNTNTDTSVFNAPLRLQVFEGASLKLNLAMVRLGTTDIWYCRDKSFTSTTATEIKLSASPSTAGGVTLTLSIPSLQFDGNFGNPEIELRNYAIKANMTQENEAYLLSLMQDSKNLLGPNTTATSATTAQLEYPIASQIQKYSAVCIIESDGVYPTENNSSASGGFKARLETINSSLVAGNTAYLKRIGNSKVWYVSNAPVTGSDIASVKLRADKLSDGTYVRIRNAVIMENGFPNPVQLLIDEATKADVLFTKLKPSIDAEIDTKLLDLGVVSHPTTAFEAITQAATRRIDIVGIGDSNQYFGGYGFDYALRNALASRFGLYATPPLQGGDKFGVQTGFSLTQAEKVLAGVEPNYIAEGSTVSGSGQQAIWVGNGALATKYLINPSSKLRCHFAYSTFTSGTGNFRIGIRNEASPYTTYAQSPVINTNTGAETYQLSQLDLEAGARDNQTLGFRFAHIAQTITGPFLSYFMRVEDVNKDSGICFSSIYGVGGQSLWDMNQKMSEPSETNPNGYTMQELTNYFSEIRRLQLSKSQKPIVVIYINSGLNDQHEEKTPSWGWRASTLPTSATAYLDNLEALTKRIEDVWQYNGWAENELFFWINPSHPISTPDHPQLISFRKAASSFAANKSRISFVDFENLTSYDDLQSRDLYDAAGPYHLKKAGYEYCADLVVDRIP